MNDDLTICKKENEHLRANLEETRRELERRYADLEAIYKIVKVIHETLDMKKLGDTVKDVIENLIGIKRYSLIIFDSVRGAYLFQVEKDFGSNLVDDVLLAMEKKHPGWMKRANEVQDTNLTTERTEEEISFICMPIYGHETMVGTLCTREEAISEMKPESRHVLTCIIGQIAIALQNTRLYELTKSLSIMDEQTNLYNLRHFQRRLSIELERAKRYRRPISLIITEIDGFAEFNLKHGAHHGDMVLFDMGTILRNHCREVDIIARYGAEQFAIALPETNEAGAMVVAEKIRQAVAAHPFMGKGGERAESLTVSIGATCYPQHIDDTRDIVEKSEEALGEAKKTGKNKVVMSSVEAVK